MMPVYAIVYAIDMYMFYMVSMTQHASCQNKSLSVSV